MKKQYFVLLLIGLIAVAGVMFTGCPEQDYDWKFENISEYTIQVYSPELSPSSFELKGLENYLVDPPTKMTATSTKTSIKLGWNIAGMDQDSSEREVLMTKSGTGVVFKKNPDGMANIKQAE
jgi:hypothetical protein